MPKKTLASQYPYNAQTKRAVNLMPDNVPLPKHHPIVITSETDNFGRLVTEVDGQPYSGFLTCDEYEEV